METLASLLLCRWECLLPVLWVKICQPVIIDVRVKRVYASTAFPPNTGFYMLGMDYFIEYEKSGELKVSYPH